MANLAGLCFILGQNRSLINIKELANEAVRRGILDFEVQQRGNRLDTRINHHMIALRALRLVEEESLGGARVHYNLTPAGEQIHAIARQMHLENGVIELNTALRAAWRPLLVESDYVRHRWLKYFMPREDFTYDQFVADAGYVTFCLAPREKRGEGKTDKNPDSGYRLWSEHWPELVLYESDRREIHQGLRHWTNEAYLTDDRVSEDEAGPFLYLPKAKDKTFEMESHIVRAWLDPDKDLPLFECLVHQLLDEKRQGDRIAIPDLIIGLCETHGYAKDNLKELLTELFYRRSSNYVFERGSKFLIDHAFNVNNKDKAAVYYLKLEGVWRTSIVRYGVRAMENS